VLSHPVCEYLLYLLSSFVKRWSLKLQLLKKLVDNFNYIWQHYADDYDGDGGGEGYGNNSKRQQLTLFSLVSLLHGEALTMKQTIRMSVCTLYTGVTIWYAHRRHKCKWIGIHAEVLQKMEIKNHIWSVAEVPCCQTTGSSLLLPAG
jgi:hypothetical protein